MKRLKREHYATAVARKIVDGINDTEVTIGIYYKDPREITNLTGYAKCLAQIVLGQTTDHGEIVARVEKAMDIAYPGALGRPFYVETSRDDMGVQVYQPYGMPLEDSN